MLAVYTVNRLVVVWRGVKAESLLTCKRDSNRLWNSERTFTPRANTRRTKLEQVFRFHRNTFIKLRLFQSEISQVLISGCTNIMQEKNYSRKHWLCPNIAPSFTHSRLPLSCMWCNELYKEQLSTISICQTLLRHSTFSHLHGDGGVFKSLHICFHIVPFLEKANAVFV